MLLLLNKGGLVVNNLCYSTILSYYSDIPLNSKIYARGDYDPINFTITWVYRSDGSNDDELKYQFDRMLNFNTANKAFYPYSVTTTDLPKIKGIIYVSNPGGSNTPPPIIKYLTSIDVGHTTFSEERDITNYKDFFTFVTGGSDYNSYFITGYRLHGKGITKWQPIYVQVFSNSDFPTAYKIQGIWDYANSGNSGKFSSIQLVQNNSPLYSVVYRKHKIRGNGISLQFKIQSVTGKPFSIIGWTGIDTTKGVM